jgi:hypothetical protein
MNHWLVSHLGVNFFDGESTKMRTNDATRYVNKNILRNRMHSQKLFISFNQKLISWCLLVR